MSFYKGDVFSNTIFTGNTTEDVCLVGDDTDADNVYNNCKILDLAGLSFVHFNVRSLNANFNSIIKFLQTNYLF